MAMFTPAADPLTEDRSYLDWRRISAAIRDWLLMIPVGFAIFFFLLRQHPVTAYFVFVAVNVTYHFLMETMCGQTIGKRSRNLRVVMRDGTPAGATAIAARTIFRFIDAQFLYLVGLITMFATGKKRQRLGDLAGGTIVRENDRSWRPAPASPLLLIYPVLWIGAALIAGNHFDPKPVALTSDAYLQQVDRACEYRMETARGMAGSGGFDQYRQLSQQETLAIEGLPKPPTAGEAHGLKVVLKWRHRIDDTAARIAADARASSEPQGTLMRESTQLLGVIRQSDARMAQLGLPHCMEATPSRPA